MGLWLEGWFVVVGLSIERILRRQLENKHGILNRDHYKEYHMYPRASS